MVFFHENSRFIICALSKDILRRFRCVRNIKYTISTIVCFYCFYGFQVEETILENLAWKSKSQLWDAIEASGHGIPKFEETALSGHILYSVQNQKNVDQSSPSKCT